MATESQTEAPAVEIPTVSQQEALKVLLQSLDERGHLQRPQELKEGDVPDGLNDEATFMRFLQGRGFDPQGALNQYEEALSIRKDTQATEAYDVISINDFEEARKMYPCWSGRRDKRGLPICMFDVAQLTSENMAKYNASQTSTARSQHTVVFHDYMTRFVLPLCASMPDCQAKSPSVVSSVYLVNAASFGLRQAWSLKGYAQEVSQLLAVCYPEMVDRCYVMNAPAYFGKIWGILSKFVDPRTAAKLIIVSSGEDSLSTLTPLLDVENIPTEYGGKFTYSPGMTPKLDDGIRRHMNWTVPGDSLPEGPIKFMQDENQRRVVSATGADRNDVIATP
ncbi:CRAL-TRIO domain-containing protein [Fusarium flagelliforme]|uniref:Cral/trio domain protein n=1 Tax=Fusarium flagelliforme TaxID=2675880 RepID=A0A395N6I0_9HYPO|nr:CRAL-TRIO domain-containing protein [Fusarium flagelliforme]KAH7198351.1 CRAL-TRIO domain-containing protein [Fusarium flagelliforme]RFN55249.1 cral/trio domain protein [Fusarium flagelliforme]